MAADEKWYFTKEQLTNTPSRRCGIDADKELSYRQQAANFIQDMGQRLVVSQLCINTAIVYMHRFYVFHSLSHFHRNAIAAAALFLAAKVEEQPRKLEHVIKMAHMCLHRDQPPPDVRSEQYLEQAQDLVFNENVLLQTLGFDVAIDHPHTHVVRCCQLVKASKDLAQTSYFMASNSLHLTTMCLQYKPTVVACFCIHLACKWSNWEIPQSTEGKHWFWYVDRSVTSELLQELTAEFLHIFDKCPSRLKRKIMSISANQSPSINHPSLPNSPFDAEPRKIQSPAMTADGPTFHTSRPHLTENKEEKKQIPAAPTRPPVDYREYREKKERERLEREKASAQTTVSQSHASDINKHHSHHHKPVSSTNVLNKHPLPPGQKTLHHNHHHRPDMKVGQPVPQRHSSSTQAREPNRDPNRQRIQREYNSNSGTSSSSSSSSTLHSHSHTSSKDTNLDNSTTDSGMHRPDVGALHEPVPHGNVQEKLSNNNHSVHRLSGIENKHQSHDKRMYDPRHKPVEHRKDGEQKPYKYPDPTRVDRQRKSDTLEQRCEEVRKLIEKPLPPPKPTLDVPYVSNSQKPSHHTKYNQTEKSQLSTSTVPTDVKLITNQSSFSQEKSPTGSSSISLHTQKNLDPKSMSSQHTAHGVSQILKDTIKNGSSQSSSVTSLNNLDDPKTEKRPRHEDTEKSSSDIQQSVLQTPPSRSKSLFSPEKVPTPRETHSQRPKTKQKTPPSAAKVPKQERVLDASIGFNLISPFASPPGLQQQETQPVKRSGSDISTSHKRHRTGSTSEGSQTVKMKLDDTSSFEAAKMLGRVPELIQPIRDNPSANGRATQIANDMKPPELIKPFDSEPSLSRFGTVSTHQVQPNQHGLTNGLDTSLVKQESQDFQIKKEPHKVDVPIKLEHSQIKSEYLSPMKSAQSISALLQEPLAPMPSLLQNMQQYGQMPPQQVHQEQFQQQQLQPLQQQQQQQHSSISHSMMLAHQESLQNHCMPMPSVSEPVIASTVDISALSGPVQTSTETILPVPTSTTLTAVPPVEEKRSEHHKSEKKKKKEKHKHKDKEKTKEKHKHKHKDKDKEKHREKDKEKGEEPVAAVPIKITIPKDKLNLSTESAGSTGGSTVPTDKNKSPQNTSIKIIIPKERLKGTDSVSSSPAQSVVQAPLKIKIRTDGMSRSSGAPSTTSSSTSIVPEFSSENRKRERSEMKESPTAGVPPTKKQSQVSSAGYGQHRSGERQNGRHYSSGSNNKEKHTSSHHKSSSKLSQSHTS